MLSKGEQLDLRHAIIARSAFNGAGVSILSALQNRPYTGVEMVVNLPFDKPEVSFSSTRFTKVQWPDVWDGDYGIALSLTKAAADIVRQWCEHLEAK